MEKVKCLFAVTFLCCLSVAHAQPSDFIRAGLIRTQLTLSPSYMLSDRQSYFYAHGTFEAYLESKVSLAGDTYIFLNGIDVIQNGFEYNHSTFMGANYHFTRNLSDFYVGAQPGFSITKLKEIHTKTSAEGIVSPTVTHAGVNPLFSMTTGYNYYIYKFFNLFVQVRLVTGQHSYDVQKPLTELRFSAGLGFNVHTKNER